MSVLTVGVFFGGRSVEHEVSVVTAMQAMAAMPADRYRAVPVYIAKTGAWYSGDALRELDAFRDIESLITRATRVGLRPDSDGGRELTEVSGRRGLMGGGARTVAALDVALPLVHGTHGEDGTLQGLFELCGLAYAGCGVTAAAVSMDKRITKSVLRAAGLPVLDAEYIDRAEWEREPGSVAARVEARIAYPIFVKPLTLGSSIGVARVESRDELAAALTTAFAYDSRALAEPAQDEIVEINCAALGRGDDMVASVCEQPVTSGALSYADKYLTKGGAKDSSAAGMKGAQRIVPAPIDDALARNIQQAAMDAFRAIGGEGLARVDFLVRPEQGTFLVNELNTVPGSLAFYLWEPAGIPFAELIDRLITLGRERHAAAQATTYSIDTWLLRGAPGR